ncbi:MAG: glycine rich domain-containing protein [Flavobacteriales bacterium]|nr:glycine rich domain-containing protein [Flavobacteriales bacterium]
MKKLLLILLCLPFIGFAQSVPQGINYQAVARDTNGDVLMNQALTIQFSVISDIATSAISWQETHTVTTNDYGLFTSIIGGGTTTSVGSSLTFDVIDWGSSNHFLKVEIDYGGSLVDLGTTAFMSVPYSLYGKDEDSDPSNEIQTLSISGDTLFISSGNYVIIPGISFSNALIIYGCIDSIACNYDSTANTDDGSCVLPDGCTDSTACNYDVNATCDDGSCLTAYGCTDTTACNYDPNATCDDGNCLTVYGCTDSTMFNYNSAATCDDGSCIAIVYGCTDSTQFNYNSSANTSGISLLTTLAGGNGSNGNMFNITNTSNTTVNIAGFSQGPGSNNTTITNAQVNVYMMPAAYVANGSSWTQVGSATTNLTPNAATGYCPVNGVNIPAGATYGFYVGLTTGTVQYTDGTGTPGVTPLASDNNITISEGLGGPWPNPTYAPRNWNGMVHYTGVQVCQPIVNGCTNSTACNYDPSATTDDGSCILPNGCTDITACNYDPNATCDDGSCTGLLGCTNSTAFNYNASATCDDGSCVNTVNVFEYTGNNQYFTIPSGVNSITVEVVGAPGGLNSNINHPRSACYQSSGYYSNWFNTTDANRTGKGGRVIGTINNISTLVGEIVQINVGGEGDWSACSSGGTKYGGWNGGGNGGSDTRFQGGGGASDIRIGNYTLQERIIVAGGGGSTSSYNNGSSNVLCAGGSGGGLTGGTGAQGSNSNYHGGQGGSPTSGGLGGFTGYLSYRCQNGDVTGVGNGGNTGGTYYTRGGGGGGGYHGGGCGYTGGGGSSYTDTNYFSSSSVTHNQGYWPDVNHSQYKGNTVNSHGYIIITLQ